MQVQVIFSFQFITTGQNCRNNPNQIYSLFTDKMSASEFKLSTLEMLFRSSIEDPDIREVKKNVKLF